MAGVMFWRSIGAIWLIGSILSTASCSQPEPEPVVTEAFFCDVEEKREFTQEEIDWRAANAPWNLRRDFRTNLAWEREECEDK